MDDLAVIARIQTLLERRPAARPDDVELALTDGYARALALEGKRRRAEKRIGQLAGNPEGTGEILLLKGHLRRIDAELAELRGLLSSLSATL